LTDREPEAARYHREFDNDEVVFGELLVAGVDAAPLLESADAPFDGLPPLVLAAVERLAPPFTRWSFVPRLGRIVPPRA